MEHTDLIKTEIDIAIQDTKIINEAIDDNFVLITENEHVKCVVKTEDEDPLCIDEPGKFNS